MRLLSLIVAFLASGALAVYVMTYSVNDAPPAPMHPIVGKWQQVVVGGRQVTPGRGMTIEYRDDGSLIFTIAQNSGGSICEGGNYTVSGNSLQMTISSQARSRQVALNFSMPTYNRLTALNTEPGNEEEFIRVNN